MKRFPGAALLFVLLSRSMGAGSPDPVQAIADDTFASVSRVAGRVVLVRWSERADELITSAPTAAIAGSRWKRGDPHWEAARGRFLTHVDRWIGDLTTDPKAKEIVTQKFAARLDAAQAESLRTSLKADATKDFAAWLDNVHLAVLFSEKNRELKIGTPEFSNEFRIWLQKLSVDNAPPAETPEMLALMRSREGAAYGLARGFAMDSLISGLDGQIQLRVFDSQKALLEEIGREAKACAKEHD